eukprot:TRINITY_DN3149_c0_g2_i1.p1 TRINITY_DN3149_c0_g2~~TRINITY_DN3149_c0_g2_i1.p1  ORF type:complete len:308 (-),score=55.06 TRINITY_DN3149_c0_g2_i1:99-1022(-)
MLRIASATAHTFGAAAAEHCSNLSSKPQTMPSSMPSRSIQLSSLPATYAQYLNVGSCGHPEMCREPCLLFQRGRCHYESSCAYCHHCHHRTKTTMHTQKLLSEMEVSTCLRILLRAMRDRVPSLRFAAAAGEFLETLESQCGRLAYIRRERVFKKQVFAFHALTFGSMISWFFRRAKNHLEPCAVTRIEEALEQLHVAIRAFEVAAAEAASRLQGEYIYVDAASSMLRPMETLAADGVALGVQAESDSLHQSDFALRPEEWLASDGTASRTQAVSPLAFESQHLAFSRNCNKIASGWPETSEQWLGS